ncbi:alpha/beta-Hydrolases superfamily protein [Prunus dulcis]|uniref:Alpha/beta-Hydrolases superfamily protein n=1 Tax=Prunus dulcis TaxID=3755 RepID=A0A4Y1QRI7_PRUDU|nr:alpha/beta-Hydrolases superfamily protein [Prunus dulcis]
MNLSLTLSFRPTEPSLFHWKSFSPIKYPQKQHVPIFHQPKLDPRRTQFRVTAKRPSPIEGLSEEMSAMASQNLDHAPARRRVRSAFVDVHKQLDHCLFKIDHVGIRTEEWYGRNSKGMQIFCKSWLPKLDVQIKGIAKRIAASGYAVYAVDYPGFGLSEGLHGYIPNFDELVDDVNEQFTNIKGRPEVKVFTSKLCFRVYMFLSISIAAQTSDNIAEDAMPPAIVLKLLAVMSEVLPQAKLFPQKDMAGLSYRDPRKRKNDHMRSRTAVELLKATSDIETQLDKVSGPLLILHGAADKVTDPLVSQLLYEKASSKDKTLKLYQDGYHCILQGEPDDRIFTALDDIVTWLDFRTRRDLSTPTKRKIFKRVLHVHLLGKVTCTLDGQNKSRNKNRSGALRLVSKAYWRAPCLCLTFSSLTSLMDLSRALRYQPLKLPLFPPQFQNPINHLHPKPTFLVPRGTRLMVTAKKRPPIEGVSEELNSIANQNLDFAYTRRQVRSAFVEVQQQLDHCLFKLAPTGIRTEEWYERNSRGLQIFCKSWMPKQGVPIKGIARRIAASGYAVYAMDYPGFGLSEGLHGYIPSFDQLADDVIEQYTKIKGRPELKGLPHFILGQSMGGAVTLKVHLKEPYAWDGVVLVAPMCKYLVPPLEASSGICTTGTCRFGGWGLQSSGIKDLHVSSWKTITRGHFWGGLYCGYQIAEDVTPPAAAQKILILMSKVMPKAKLIPQKDLAELAFRDPIKRKMAVYNVTCYNDHVRLKTAVELLYATKDIEMQVEKVSSPLLILHGAADKVTDPLVSQYLYEKASSEDKTLKLYPEGYHCILEGEPDDRIFSVLDDIITWLDSRCALT